MIRSIGKTLYACAYSWAGMSRWKPGPDPKRMPFIVGYHRIVESFSNSVRHAIPSMLTSVRMLEQHLDWLGRNFEFLSLDEIGFHLENGRPFRKPAAAITFDDGYSDVYRYAYPVLVRKGIPAGVFLVTDLIGTKRVQLYDKLYLLISRLAGNRQELAASITGTLHRAGLSSSELVKLNDALDEPFRLMTLILSRLPQSAIKSLIAALEQSASFDPGLLEEFAPMSWEMAAEMYRNGFTIGSHTLSHALLTQESLSKADYELILSKQTVEARIRSTVKHFAYPDGRFNHDVVRAVKAAGYRYAYGICPARDSEYPLLTIPRKVLWEQACLNPMGRFSPLMMDCQVRWAFDRFRGCEHDHGINGVKQPCPVRLNID